jgi:CBS domain-containing membrane protein
MLAEAAEPCGEAEATSGFVELAAGASISTPPSTEAQTQVAPVARKSEESAARSPSQPQDCCCCCWRHDCESQWSLYCQRWGGLQGVCDERTRPLKRESPSFILWSGLGAFLGIGVATVIHDTLVSQYGESSVPADTYVAGSFGAMATLVYGLPRAPLSQPRNCFWGQTICCFCGVACRKLFNEVAGVPELAAMFGVSLSIMIMQLFRAVHPPAGGTALIAAIGGPAVDRLGWGLIVPVWLSTSLLLVVALLVNNFVESRRYPNYWHPDMVCYAAQRD